MAGESGCGDRSVAGNLVVGVGEWQEGVRLGVVGW